MNQLQQIDPELQKLFAQANVDILASLPDLRKINVEQARRILARYDAAIEGNFTSWMGVTIVSARSLAGRYAASENLTVEMRDDHPTMLRDFVRYASAIPTIEDQADVFNVLESYRQLFAQMRGLRNLSAMATLEGTSAVFIPWLGDLSKKCGGTSFKYIEVHGKADVVHAEQFLLAVAAEVDLYNPTEVLPEIRIGIGRTIQFLHFLFNGSSRH